MALGGAVACVALLVMTWFLAFHVTLVGRADRAILDGFAGLHRPRVDVITNFIAGLCDPKPYVYLAAVPVMVALLRRRPRVAVAVGLIMLGANLTTQLLKPLLATPRPVPALNVFINEGSWPSGHATAVMSLALSAVLVAPARRRPIVATVMAAFTVAVCYSFLELGWHYPSDVLGGFEIATTWTLLGTAALFWLEARSPRPSAADEVLGPVPISAALAPVGILIGAGLLVVGVIALLRPHSVLTYADAHTTFVVGAAAIAACSLTLATAATLALRR
jgi:membrane-associated phospholipid phosphatase